jgi:hypothetical protein
VNNFSAGSNADIS